MEKTVLSWNKYRGEMRGHLRHRQGRRDRNLNRILNFGSLNNDRTYRVQNFAAAGETILAQSYQVFCGGKGLNQSIAAARAGGRPVYHAGAVGFDGEALEQMLRENGVDLRYLQHLKGPSGHAVIQINEQGQNCIVVYGGTNCQLTRPFIGQVLSHFGTGDFLMVQNEINEVPYILEKAHGHGMKIVLNPSPITPELCGNYPLELVDYFVLNENEGAALAGGGGCYGDILDRLTRQFPRAVIVLTVGDQGVLYSDGSETLRHGIYPVPVADTTAAGDTFCGYFVASTAQGMSPALALERACAASALAVSRPGAAPSIPTRDEVLTFLAERGGRKPCGR